MSTTYQTGPWNLCSPDKKLCVSVFLDPNGSLYYSVQKNGDTVLQKSRLGICTDREDFKDGLQFVETKMDSIARSYQMPCRKKERYEDCYNERIVTFQKNNHDMWLRMRAYNDGIAYRYYLPGAGPAEIYHEYTECNFCEGVKAWGHEWRDEYEGEFRFVGDQDVLNASSSMPLLLSVPGGKYWALVSEGNVYNSKGTYCASVLTGEKINLLKYKFSPSQKGPVEDRYPLQTPQRFVILTEDLNSLVNSTMSYNVNPESVLKDISWVKPGRAAWSWWSEDYYEHIDTTFEQQKRYVDFASEIGWEYVTVDAGWQDWKKGSIREICDYAKEKNVGIFLWSNGSIYLQPEYENPDNRYHAANFKDQQTGEYIEHIKEWASWGIKGLKVDFMLDDSQSKMKMYQEIIELCAKYHLMLNFHGCTKPGGEGRTWPNIVTAEGVRGAEHYLDWFPKPTAFHNCTLPFTRNVIGPMDYTPCVISKDNITTTQAHQLALPIIFESGIQHLADSPDVYRKWVGFELLKRIPSSWDELKLMDGYPGSFVVMARRKGTEWFIGGITVEARNVSLPLTFLHNGNYNAFVYRDGDSNNEIKKQVIPVGKDDCLNIPMLAEGGFAAWIIESNN